MGILDTPVVLTTPAAVRQFTTLPEVSSISDDPTLQRYINRAEFLLSRLFDYDPTLSYWQEQMGYAVELLVENLVVINLPSYKRSAAGNFKAEQIGTYSYSRGSSRAAGNQDLEGPNYFTDEILAIIRAFVLGNPYKYQTTRVFIPQTESFDKSGILYAVPDDVLIDETRRDPPIPIKVESE